MCSPSAKNMSPQYTKWMEFNESLAHPSDPVVFLDIESDSVSCGRIIIDLMVDVVPQTTENFKQLCAGALKIPGNGEQIEYGYRGTNFDRIVKDKYVKGGKINEVRGCKSLYGDYFPNENFLVAHDAAELFQCSTTES
ncbi:hypothetical protein niasHS_009315 [Heterodera schachtii]|uniref:PPIase cyclophilin-type domain-containing protein n=1 Tax=Heterodera schachtii TaxID=97005 RepID=A0ABD2JBW7_HETSC